MQRTVEVSLSHVSEGSCDTLFVALITKATPISAIFTEHARRASSQAQIGRADQLQIMYRQKRWYSALLRFVKYGSGQAAIDVMTVNEIGTEIFQKGSEGASDGARIDHVARCFDCTYASSVCVVSDHRKKSSRSCRIISLILRRKG